MIQLNFKYGLCLLFAFSITFSNAQNSTNNPILLTKKTDYKAGDNITIKFQSDLATVKLYCSSGYGSVLVEPETKDYITTYTLPKFMTEKSGVINWRLTGSLSDIQGLFKIIPLDKTETMETYLGPPTINAGDTDYAMLISIPTDQYDNPLADGTSVTVYQNFKNSIDSFSVKTNHFLGYKNIYATKESGRLLVSTSHDSAISKEFTLDVLPSIPTDFEIFAERPHPYADANQITTLSTSVITDLQNNTVSDGTLVTFVINTKDNQLLKASGTTINGIAMAKIIHPDRQAHWMINAYIEGMAKSSSLSLDYKQAVKDFNVKYSDKGRTIRVGPFQSFMNQLVPDGLSVDLEISKEGKIIYNTQETTRDGFAVFHIRPELVQDGDYDLKVSSAGLEKNLNNIRIW